MTSPELRRTIDALWRMESPRLIASLTRMLRDVGLAEDMAQEALVAALERWPRDGVPDNPAAVSYTHLDVYKRQTWTWVSTPTSSWRQTARSAPGCRQVR